MKSISVIMSTRDTEDNQLRMSISSILNQSFSDFEFIIVCDGSDSNLKVINEFHDERIKIIVNEEPLGLPISLNKAIVESTGKYIARMDSDDYSLKNRFKIQFDFLEKNHDIDVCSTYTCNFGNDNKLNINIFNSSDLLKSELLIENGLAHPSVMMRSEFIKTNNIFYSEAFKYSQDFELWSRIMHEAKMYIIPKICLFYRIHDNQVSTSKFEEQCKLCDFIYRRNLEKIGVEYKDIYSDYLLFLSGKKDNNIVESEVLEFINLIIDKSSGLFDKKSVSQVLYYNYWKNCVRYKKKSLDVINMFKMKVYFNIIKLIVLKIKFKFIAKYYEKEIINYEKY